MRIPKILVVDDFGPWRSMMCSQLTNCGFHVVGEARNGIEAIEKAAQLRPDVVLLDLEMPLVNGLEAAPKIREVSPGSKIIFLSQQGDSDIRTAALATGAVNYLLKVEAGDVASAIHAALGTTQPVQPLCPSLVLGLS